MYIYFLLRLEISNGANYPWGALSMRQAERRNVLPRLDVHLLCLYVQPRLFQYGHTGCLYETGRRKSR